MLCRFVDTLGCDETAPKRLNGCRHCGWNPAVAQQRAEKIRAARAQKRSPRAAEAHVEAHEDNMMIPQLAALCKG